MSIPKNMKHLSLVVATILLGTVLTTALFLGGAKNAYASSCTSSGCTLIYITQPGKPTPLASAIYINAWLDKSSYAPGETITVNFFASSDDSPQNGGCLQAYATINGVRSADAYPGCYAASLPAGVPMAVTLTAPSTSGSVIISVGSSGYGAANFSIPFTVVAPVAPPTVQLWFQ